MVSAELQWHWATPGAPIQKPFGQIQLVSQSHGVEKRVISVTLTGISPGSGFSGGRGLLVRLGGVTG